MKAFPRNIEFHNGTVRGDWIDDGMDLRDYFAAKAMQGLLTTVKDEEWRADETAEIAYLVADAMMKAREQ